MTIDPNFVLIGFGILASGAGGVLWVGRTNGKIKEHGQDISDLKVGLNKHSEVSNETNQAVGRIEGKLEVLLSRTPE